jgi:predicted acetyltransferase
MTALIREYREDDRKQVGMIWSAAFDAGQPNPNVDNPDVRLDTRSPEEDSQVLVADEDGLVAGAFQIFYTPMTCRGALFKCGGVSGVAVTPAARKRHIGSAMMTYGIEHMHSTGETMTNLHAAHEIFYRRFGWECCGRDVHVTCPVPLFPRTDCPLPIRQLSVDDWAPLDLAYEKFAFRYSGMRTSRKGFGLSRLTQTHGTPPFVFAAGDPVEAYALLRLTRNDDLDVIEFVWATLEGYESMLATLAGVGINRQTITWAEPSTGPFLSSKWFTRGMTARLPNPSMFRVINVPDSLTGLSTTESGSFTMVIDDEILPSNRGPWRVSFSPEGIHVEPTDSGDLQIDIRQYSQAWLGEPSLENLLEHGFVSCSSADAVKAATALLPPKTTYTLEYF